MIFKIITISYL